MTHPHTTDTAPRRHTTGRAGKAQGAPQDRGHSTTQKHSTQKKAQESTQEYIEVCYSSSVEHKGTDHTVAPNHSTCSPQLYVLYNNYIYNVYKDGKYRLEGGA